MNSTLKVAFLFFLTTSISLSADFDMKQHERNGDIIQLALPASVVCLSLWQNDQDGMNRFYYAFGSTMAITHLFKVIIPEKRPDSNALNSYISGHTSAAFSGATLIYKQYGWKFGLPAMAAASYVGWSRVASERHHEGDVYRGAALGLGVTLLISAKYKQFEIHPAMDANQYGLQVNYKF